MAVLLALLLLVGTGSGLPSPVAAQDAPAAAQNADDDGGVTTQEQARENEDDDEDGGVLAGIQAPAVVVMDILTGEILLDRQADEPRFPASITKVMTLLLVLDALEAGQISLDDEVRVSAEAAGWGGTQIFLEPGEVLALRDLLKSVAIASANDAAAALAEHVAGSVEEFVAMMNQRAEALGMGMTRFNNPHGIDDGLEVADHHMSARDVAVVSRELIRRHPEVLELTGTWMDRVRDPDAGQCCELVNTNRLVRNIRGVDGLKTGHTSRAGYGIAATAERDGTRFLAVLMGHPSRPERDEEAVQLLNWAFARWESVPIIKAGDPVRRLQVHEGILTEVDLVAAGDFGVLVPRGRGDALEQDVEIQEPLLAPVAGGQILGRLEVRLDGEVLGAVDLVSGREVPRLSLPGLWLRLLGRAWPWR